MKAFKLIVGLVLICLPLMIAADRCSYDYCYKEELHRCEDTKNRELCNNKGGLFITYREGTFKGSKHKCCMWRLEDVLQKHLGCVRNIRTLSKKCTSQGGDYELKLRTLEKCNTFSCE